MPKQIFISYRRSDTGPEALSIGQFLEREFGRGSVFMDIDINAGTDFPAILDMRLAQSAVLLALIGPNWLMASDKAGVRRLDNPEDWVRQEIARALARRLTVIPVCINGADLPDKSVLPEDIRELVNRQAAFVTTAHFRNDMSGLVRDIRALPAGLRWRHIAFAGMAVLLTLLAGGAIVRGFGVPWLAMLNGHGSTVEQPPDSPAQTVQVPLTGTIHFYSESGDYIGGGKNWTVSNSDGIFSGTVQANSVTIDYRGDDLWNLTFAAPEGKRLAPGTYSNASRAPFNSPVKPGLDISGAGRGCNTLSGQFTIRQIAYSDSGTRLARFLADFQQHCEGGVAALSGTIDLTADNSAHGPSAD
jgi:hypothetical protein